MITYLLKSRISVFRLAIVDVFWVGIFPADYGLKILIFSQYTQSQSQSQTQYSYNTRT